MMGEKHSREMSYGYDAIEPNTCCLCCYFKPASGPARALCTCTKCCFWCCGCGCLLLLAVIVELLIGFLAGKAFVDKHLRYEQNLTSCVPIPAPLDVLDNVSVPFRTGGFLERMKGELRQQFMLEQGRASFCDAGSGPPYTPDNFTEAMWFPGCTSTEVVDQVKSFSRTHPWKKVHFRSQRQAASPPTSEALPQIGLSSGAGFDAGSRRLQMPEQIMLDAWWLPAHRKDAPRIVVIHDANLNFNDWTVQVAAYLLRSLGFSVLLPNLRDHGSSGKATNASRITWAYVYHLDVLGAWHYAVDDPADQLGGAVDRSKVGLMGFGVGGMAVATAAGLEAGITGVWVDSAAFEPKSVLFFRLRRALGLLSVAVEHVSWLAANKLAVVNISRTTPAMSLKKRALTGQKCMVAAVASGQDDFIPAAETDRLVQLLRSLPDHYEVLEYYRPDSAHCGAATHSATMLWRPDEYRAKLCHFWSRVFKEEDSTCGIMSLPHFGMDMEARPGWHPTPREELLR